MNFLVNKSYKLVDNLLQFEDSKSKLLFKEILRWVLLEFGNDFNSM